MTWMLFCSIRRSPISGMCIFCPTVPFPSSIRRCTIRSHPLHAIVSSSVSPYAMPVEFSGSANRSSRFDPCPVKIFYLSPPEITIKVISTSHYSISSGVSCVMAVRMVSISILTLKLAGRFYLTCLACHPFSDVNFVLHWAQMDDGRQKRSGERNIRRYSIMALERQLKCNDRPPRFPRLLTNVDVDPQPNWSCW
jgi:hypothetical protein